MDSILVIGGGGHAKVLISVLKKLGFEVKGYTDRQDKGTILGIPYLGKDDILRGKIGTAPRPKVAMGIGKVGIVGLRAELQKEFEALGWEFPPILSPTATINEEVQVGFGTVVFDHVVINPGTFIGNTCIINTSCTVEHDCNIGHNVHIAPGATLSGGVKVGDNCLIGTGANVIQSISICADCLIGSGATVVSDIEVPGTYVGSPARMI